MTKNLLSFIINRLAEGFAQTNYFCLQTAQYLENLRFKSNSLGSTLLLSSMMRTFDLGIRTGNCLDFFGSNLKFPNLERRINREVQSYMGMQGPLGLSTQRNRHK